MDELSRARKQPSLQDFLNQDKNNGMFHPKSKSWNKKKKNKNMTSAKQKFNRILLQKRNKNITRFWQGNLPKIGVEYIKGNGESYLSLHLLRA
jgi:hypothetical protein